MVKSKTSNTRAWLLSAAALAACSDDGESTGYAGLLTAEAWEVDAGASPRAALDLSTDSSAPAADAKAPEASSDAGADGGVDAGPEALPTNTPGATLSYVGNGSSEGLALVASNLLQETSGSDIYANWLFTVRNDGVAPVCSVLVTGTFLDGSGTELATIAGLLEAVPSVTQSGSQANCLPPGELAAGWGNDFMPTAVDLARVARIDYAFSGYVSSGARAIAGPSLEGLSADPNLGSRTVTGTFRNGPATLQFPEVVVYPVNAAGMPLERVSDIETLTLAPYSTWSFETSKASAAIDVSTAIVAIDFRLP